MLKSNMNKTALAIAASCQCMAYHCSDIISLCSHRLIVIQISKVSSIQPTIFIPAPTHQRYQQITGVVRGPTRSIEYDTISDPCGLDAHIEIVFASTHAR